MRSKFLLIALGSALAGCQTTDRNDVPSAGIVPVNVPVVTSTNYVFDAAASGGSLAPGEAQRLNGWFQGLGLGYGDSVYVDGGYAPSAREQVAAIAGHYGMFVTSGAPVTPGMVQPGSVRVVVARRRAEVPGCPNWNHQSQPDWTNRSLPGSGCGPGAIACRPGSARVGFHARPPGQRLPSAGADAFHRHRRLPSLTGQFARSGRYGRH